MQDRVFMLRADLEVHQIEATYRASQDAGIEYERARTMIFLVGGVALLIGLGVASVTIRHTEKNESRLFREKQRALVTLHSIGDGVITTNKDGHIEYLNSVAEQRTGWRSADARGKTFSEVFHLQNESGSEPAADPVIIALQQGCVISSVTTQLLQSEDGQRFAVEFTAAPIRDFDQRVLGAVFVFCNMTELREMAHQATHDKLTGLFNRQEFEKRLELALASVRSGNVHVLLYMDLDQ